MNLKTIALAAIVALTPAATLAATISPSSNISNGGSYDIANGPFFWDATFSRGDGAGSASFTFTNSTLGRFTAGVAQGTVLQFSGSFNGVTIGWGNGQSQTIAPGQNAIINVRSRLASGGSDTLNVAWGAVTGDMANIDLDIAAVPLPAGALLLGTALVGVSGLRRTRRSRTA
ncbi:VPLPA-CTERM sorting domain-containing protein [Fluviibacterium sp. DFM31]|uniref:VPLPA-CTERM sorting domain-containing protein n=1 Tax=Meridianimarinicoccus marinus TaxID=3231483 RepID=A0ABV3L3M5_9RHOB